MAKQITDEQAEALIEKLLEKMQKANEFFLTNIGEKIKKIKELKPTDAHRLIQILKYGGNYEEIIKKISKVADKSIDELDTLFSSYARKDQLFNKEFYEYRNIPFIEYNKNSALKSQTESLITMAKKEMYDYTRSNVLGYTIRDNKGRELFKGLREVYNDVLDQAFINVGQGKDTFDSAMRSILKDIGQSGLKTIDYKSGRAVRLDSTIRMHLRNRLKELHDENQMLFGQEFEADGVEISVHENPAIDHELVQGRQFSNEEYEKLQSGTDAKDYKGNTYNLDHDSKNGYRPIGEMNCYHVVFSIVLGVSEPEYTDEQLQKILEDNDKGFEFEGKHYTMYEGTQLQRQIEREIRKQKDIQILGRASNDKTMIGEADKNIKILTDKYNELTKASGLKPKAKRLSVTGYHSSIRAKKNTSNVVADSNYNVIDKARIANLKENEIFISKEENKRVNEYFIKGYEDRINDKDSVFGLRDFEKERYNKLLENRKNGYKDEIIQLNTIEDCNKLLEKVNTQITGDSIKNTDFRLVAESSKALYQYSIKSPSIMKDLIMNRARLSAEEHTSGVANTIMNHITLNNEDFSNYDKFYEMCKDNTELHDYLDGKKHSWWTTVAKGNETKEIITHEFGHRLHKEAYMNGSSYGSKAFEFWADKIGSEVSEFTPGRRYIPYEASRKIRRELIYEPIRRLQAKTGLTQKEIIDKYVSMYGRKDYEEMFAETFANSQLGAPNELGKELIEFLIELGEWKR